MKDITTSIDKQYELLKLIVQKMEIHTESDEKDVGTDTVRGNNKINTLKTTNLWQTTIKRKNLIQQASIVAKFSRSHDNK